MSGVSEKKLKKSNSKRSVKRSSSKRKNKNEPQLPRVATMPQSDTKSRNESVQLKLTKSPQNSTRSSKVPPMPLRNSQNKNLVQRKVRDPSEGYLEYGQLSREENQDVPAQEQEYQDVEVPVQIHVAEQARDYTMSDSSLQAFNVMSDNSKSLQTSHHNEGNRSLQTSDRKMSVIKEPIPSKVLTYSNSKSHLTFGSQLEQKSQDSQKFQPLRNFSKKKISTQNENIEIVENPFVDLKQVDSGSSSNA